MADRRMFSKTIVNSARFLKMPASSRLLYYDLGMAADDEGVAEAYTVMQMTGASGDDLNVLVARGFVRVLNDDLVIVILDWKKNNLIKNDRFHESIYHDLVESKNSTILVPDCFQVGSKLEPEVRLGKYSTKDAQIDTQKSRFDVFWNDYPRKENKKKAYDAWKKIRIDDSLFDTIISKLDIMKRSDAWLRDNGKYIPYASTWLNGRRWEDEIEQPDQPKPKPFVIGDDGHAHYV